MAGLARKLQLKGRGIRLLHVPAEIELDLPADEGADAVLLFIHDRAELDDRAAPALEAARRDQLAWIAYPKGGQLGTDLNRDSLWKALDDTGVRPVRQISIDETWSALRFRPA